MLTSEEKYKLEIIHKAIERKLTNAQAAKILSVTDRQIRRIKASVRKEGEKAVVHKLKNKVSNNSQKSLKEKALEIVKEKYFDFKPSFASEKLLENHCLKVQPETLRLWMTQENLWKVKKQRKTKLFSFRQRKEYFGEMQQFDGSFHKWFEDRTLDSDGYPLEVCLLASIDDATSQITGALFALNEGVFPVFSFWRKYLKINGKPISIYLDKYSTYKVNHKNAVDNFELLTQFERATKQLDIKLIRANTPQAKGRVERLFGTLQDRLTKELRLANINSIDKANEFLKIFVPKFNKQFSILPAKKGNLHRVLNYHEEKALNSIFSVKSERIINNDFTIQFKNRFYQLKEIQPVTIRQKEKIIVEEHVNGKVKFVFKQKYLNYFQITKRPEKVKASPAVLTTHKTNWKPPPDHPWRKFNF